MKHLHLGALCAALAGVWPTFALGAPAEAADSSLKQLYGEVIVLTHDDLSPNH